MKRSPLFLVIFFSFSALAATQATVVLTPSQVQTVIDQQAGAPPPPPPPPVSDSTCAGFTNTYIADLSWSTPVRIIQPMQLNDVVLVRFTTGNLSSTNNLPHIVVTEYGGVGPAQRTAGLSTSPCVFSLQSGMAPGAVSVGNTITSVFAIKPGSGYGFYPVLEKNTTYYLSVKNNPGGGCSLGDSCQISIDLLKAGL